MEIGRVLGVSRQTASRWRRRFLMARLRGLEPRAAARVVSGRIAEERVRAIARAAGLRDAARNRPWSTRRLARAMGVSHSTIRRIWDAYGVRPVRFGAWPPRPDPEQPLVPRDILGVYLRPPDYGVALSLSREDGPAYGGGMPREREQEVASPLAALLQGWPGVPGPSRGARLEGWLRFLAALTVLARATPDIALVGCAPGLLPAREIAEWRSAHPTVRMELLESPEQWSVRLAGTLAALGRSGASRYFGARGELVRSVRLALAAYSSSSGPFQWVASEKEASAGEAGFRLRYDLSVTGHPGFKKAGAVERAMPRNADADPRARAMARLVLRKSLRVRPDERVTIESWSGTLEYANAFVLESLRLGARPILLYQDEPTYWAAASEVPPAQLARVGEHQRAAMARSDVFVSFYGPSDRARWHALPRPTMFKLDEHREALYRAAARSGSRAVQLALGRASEASARLYGTDLAPWREELIEGTLVDPDKLHRRAAPLADRLKRGRVVEIHHPNGTRLRLGLRHRTPSVSDGRVPRASPRVAWDLVQLPAGVVMVALDERVADGSFHSNVPNSVGVMDSIGEVAGAQWDFVHGRLTRYRYEQGQDLFAQSYGRAGPGRDVPGILSIGLNERIDKAPLLQDQAYGAITLQLGRNVQLGGATANDWWAWLILRGADLAIDGRPVLRAGKLVL
jgi:leucyl aminopeptidase (aminopeptidase T)